MSNVYILVNVVNVPRYFQTTGSSTSKAGRG